MRSFWNKIFLPEEGRSRSKPMFDGEAREGSIRRASSSSLPKSHPNPLKGCDLCAAPAEMYTVECCSSSWELGDGYSTTNQFHVERTQCNRTVKILQRATEDSAQPIAACLLKFLVKYTYEDASWCTLKERQTWLVAQLSDRVRAGGFWVGWKVSRILHELVWCGSLCFAQALHRSGRRLFSREALEGDDEKEGEEGEKQSEGGGRELPVEAEQLWFWRGYLESLCEYRLRYPQLHLHEYLSSWSCANVGVSGGWFRASTPEASSNTSLPLHDSVEDGEKQMGKSDFFCVYPAFSRTTQLSELYALGFDTIALVKLVAAADRSFLLPSVPNGDVSVAELALAVRDKDVQAYMVLLKTLMIELLSRSVHRFTLSFPTNSSCEEPSRLSLHTPMPPPAEAADSPSSFSTLSVTEASSPVHPPDYKNVACAVVIPVPAVYSDETESGTSRSLSAATLQALNPSTYFALLRDWYQFVYQLDRTVEILRLAMEARPAKKGLEWPTHTTIQEFFTSISSSVQDVLGLSQNLWTSFAILFDHDRGLVPSAREALLELGVPSEGLHDGEAAAGTSSAAYALEHASGAPLQWWVEVWRDQVDRVQRVCGAGSDAAALRALSLLSRSLETLKSSSSAAGRRVVPGGEQRGVPFGEPFALSQCSNNPESSPLTFGPRSVLSDSESEEPSMVSQVLRKLLLRTSLQLAPPTPTASFHSEEMSPPGPSSIFSDIDDVRSEEARFKRWLTARPSSSSLLQSRTMDDMLLPSPPLPATHVVSRDCCAVDYYGDTTSDLQPGTPLRPASTTGDLMGPLTTLYYPDGTSRSLNDEIHRFPAYGQPSDPVHPPPHHKENMSDDSGRSLTVPRTMSEVEVEASLQQLLHSEEDVVVVCQEPCSCNDSVSAADRFQVLYDMPLGRGSFGSVFRAWDRLNGVFLAVKEISLSHSNNRYHHQHLRPNSTSRSSRGARKLRDDPRRSLRVSEALHEYTALTLLSHPNVVRVKAFTLQGTIGRIFMEWIPAGSLSDVLQQRREQRLREYWEYWRSTRSAHRSDYPRGSSGHHEPSDAAATTGEKTNAAARPPPFPFCRMGFEEHLVARYILDTLRGLAYLHSRRVLHRDIKPANLLLSTNGYVKLTDFGTAHEFGVAGVGETDEDAEGTLHASRVFGTVAYISPESLTGTYSPSSDVWSLGCTVVELLTGWPPWSPLAPEDEFFQSHCSASEEGGSCRSNGDVWMSAGGEPGESGSPNPVALLFKIGNLGSGTGKPELPHHVLTPGSVSPALWDFLEQIFVIDRLQRPTAEMLLRHPFITLAAGKCC